MYRCAERVPISCSHKFTPAFFFFFFFSLRSSTAGCASLVSSPSDLFSHIHRVSCARVVDWSRPDMARALLFFPMNLGFLHFFFPYHALNFHSSLYQLRLIIFS
jgi:hypothetical protein